MAKTNIQFVNQAQKVNRSIYETVQGIAETQFAILQRFSGIQQEIFSQAVGATNEQVHLVSRARDPREFASAQAEFVKSHGPRYVHSIKEAVDVVVDAW